MAELHPEERSIASSNRIVFRGIKLSLLRVVEAALYPLSGDTRSNCRLTRNLTSYNHRVVCFTSTRRCGFVQTCAV